VPILDAAAPVALAAGEAECSAADRRDEQCAGVCPEWSARCGRHEPPWGRLVLGDVSHAATADECGPVHFLDSRGPNVLRDWEGNARQIVALLRAEAGRSPYDRILSHLVGELATRSDLFRTLWGSYDVREHRTGVKSIHHPVVGDLDLTFEAMDLTSDRGLQLLAFFAAPGSPSHDGLQLLANWAATNQVDIARNDTPATTDAADRP
jgi:hypothetical protein